jgi:hypothetical protein
MINRSLVRRLNDIASNQVEAAVWVYLFPSETASSSTALHASQITSQCPPSTQATMGQALPPSRRMATRFVSSRRCRPNSRRYVARTCSSAHRRRRWNTRSCSQYSQNNECSLRSAIIANCAKRIALLGHDQEGRSRSCDYLLKTRMSTAHNDAQILERPLGAARANASDHEQILPLVLDFPKSHSGVVGPKRATPIKLFKLLSQG